jgi:alcohol dehydrogenase (cytochrome c)
MGGVANKHLYHNSTLAIDADSGRIAWHYQHVVDHWDLDHPFERLLVDTAVAPNASEVRWINPRIKPGERRKVITGVPGKTGLVYTLDRQTGEFLWARPTVLQTVISRIDGATGQTVFVCPTANGGKNWEASAYSPLTNVMFVPLRNTCAQGTAVAESRKNTSLYGVAFKEAQVAPNNGGNVGTIYAISAETGATSWKFEQRAATMSLVATGGGVLFGGDVSGRFRALDQRSGKVLWEINLGSPVTGYPISYAVDGKQYVAVSTGVSLTQSGLSGLTPELRPSTGNNLFVFALP